MRDTRNKDTSGLEKRTISIKRVTKTTKGGKRLRFQSCCAVGDCQSRVGVGLGKAQEVASAVNKAEIRGEKNMIEVKQREGTIPHSVYGKCGASKIFMRPASPGTGIIACGSARAILELGGIRNVLTKAFGSHNSVNLAKATIDALLKLRTSEEVATLRGIWKKQ
jgi:small subunit ribosomal protein S5